MLLPLHKDCLQSASTFRLVVDRDKLPAASVLQTNWKANKKSSDELKESVISYLALCRQVAQNYLRQQTST